MQVPFFVPEASAKSKTEAHPPPRICPSLSRPPRITIVGRGTGCLSRPCIPSGCGILPQGRHRHAACAWPASPCDPATDASMHKPGRHWGPHHRAGSALPHIRQTERIYPCITCYGNECGSCRSRPSSVLFASSWVPALLRTARQPRMQVWSCASCT